ncbi:MAG: T9SS type A sorting domain-containing protein [Bacteroidetes bacterium]|nr:T9SS type A sorting domain-containing protein [Bacteroidota bacterium]
MKKVITIVLMLLGSYHIEAQVLNVPQIIQEQTQWCWSASSTCILDYYNHPVTQCQVAEYARSVITWHNFGTVNCCIDAGQGCNYWNYNWGNAGSIDDILSHFGNISTSHAGALTINEIQNNVAHNHLMVYHWSWVGGGGHFIVGYGANTSTGNVYYMNPLPGEGLTMQTYAFMSNDGSHTYDATQSVLSPTTVPATGFVSADELIYPNPSTGGVYVRNADHVKVYNALGALVYSNSITSSDKGDFVDLSTLAKGIYFVSLAEGNNSNFTKLVLQ